MRRPLLQLELKSSSNTKQQTNPFSFLLILRLQEGLLSAHCPLHIVSSSPQYESNYKTADVCTFNSPCKVCFIRSNSPRLKVISQQPSKSEMFSLLADRERVKLPFKQVHPRASEFALFIINGAETTFYSSYWFERGNYQ